MDSNRLLQFKAIAESGNMSKAAEKLFVSQPGLSKSLSVLEAELGCKLFNRVGRKLYLNADGRKLLQYANRIHEIIEQLTDDFRQQSNRTLSICSIGNYFHFLLKDYFKDGVRPISLNLVPDQSIPEILFSGDADVVIADDYYLEANANIGLRRIPILYEQLLLSVPKNSHLADQKTIKITDLQNERIMRSTTITETNFWLDKALEINKVNINWYMSLDSETWRYYMLTNSENMPLCFENSSSFSTQQGKQRIGQHRSLLKVEGIYTDRMVYIWYFEKNKELLSEFLQSVKNMYT